MTEGVTPKSLQSFAINDLLNTYAEALGALVPAMDKSRIDWRSRDDYAWETIFYALYDAFVRSVIVNAFPVPAADFAGYGLWYDDYRGVSYIAVQPQGNGPNAFAFLNLQPAGGAFDVVQFVRLNDALAPIGDPQEAPLGAIDASLSLLHDARRTFIRQVTLDA